jgi:inner membrane protein COX18
MVSVRNHDCSDDDCQSCDLHAAVFHMGALCPSSFLSIWPTKLAPLQARRRSRKAADVVQPALAAEAQNIAEAERKNMAREGISGSKDRLREEFFKRYNATVRVLVTVGVQRILNELDTQMKKRHNELLKRHVGSPVLTTLIPIMTQLPFFVGMSYFFNHLAQPPASFILDSESFLSLTSLTHTDPTGTLPIAIGLITYANVESANWFLGEQVQANDAREKVRNEALRARGELALPSLSRIMRTIMRVAAVGRIVIATMWPGVRVVPADCKL